MRRTRLLLPDFPSETSLTESVLHYLKHVLRLDNGCELEVFDGRGQAYVANLQYTGKKTAQLLLHQTLPAQTPSSLVIHLGLCISKSQHMDIALQKSTELGVSMISPIISARSEYKSTHNKLNHWKEILVNACQQSGNNFLPCVCEPLTLPTWTAMPCGNTPKLICIPHQPMRLQTARSHQQVIILIGPEGGFTEGEISTATAEGFISTGLGPRVLRTETAPIVAISLLQFLSGDLRPFEDSSNQ